MEEDAAQRRLPGGRQAAAGRDFQKLRESLTNQESFARAARQLIRDLKLGDESADLQDEDDQESQDQENADGQSNETGDDQSDSSESQGYGAQGEETEDASEQEDASETTADQAQTEMQMGSGDEEEPGRAERPWLPPGALSNEPLGQQYHAYTVKFDEIVDADQLCDAEELGRLRNHLEFNVSGSAVSDCDAPTDRAITEDDCVQVAIACTNTCHRKCTVVSGTNPALTDLY